MAHINEHYIFNFNDNWKGYLVQNGFVVIRQVVPAEITAEYLSDMWTIMETLSNNRVRREDPRSWVASANYPFMMHGGMVQYIGHSRMQWQARERCARVFAALWDCPVDKLSSSFDGFCFMNGARNYRQQAQNSFLHMDQSPLNPDLSTVQGFLNLVDCDSTSGGLVLVPGSHDMNEFFEDGGVVGAGVDGKALRRPWYLFNDAEKQRMTEQGIEHIKVNCRAGDFVLWDSRTWHCNTVPTESTKIRACIYICMLPKAFVPRSVLAKRAVALRDKRTSNHHPGVGFSLFPVLPRFAKRHLLAYLPMVQIDAEMMTPLGKILADYIE